VNSFISFIVLKNECRDFAHASSYTVHLDCITLETELVVAGWTDVGYYIQNDSEILSDK
jgi:hypothetical protein